MNNTNIFFDLNELKYCGKNVIIGKTVRIRYPHLVTIADNCIIDDFTYISTALELQGFNHISAGCKIIGGSSSKFIMKPYSTLSPNVVIAAGSDDYLSGIATPLVDFEFKGNVEYGTVVLGRHSIIVSSSVILPNGNIKDGASVGALSLVIKDLEEWGLYVGVPVKKIKERKKELILQLEKDFKLKNK